MSDWTMDERSMGNLTMRGRTLGAGLRSARPRLRSGRLAGQMAWDLATLVTLLGTVCALAVLGHSHGL